MVIVLLQLIVMLELALKELSSGIGSSLNHAYGTLYHEVGQNNLAKSNLDEACYEVGVLQVDSTPSAGGDAEYAQSSQRKKCSLQKLAGTQDSVCCRCVGGHNTCPRWSVLEASGINQSCSSNCPGHL